MILPEPEGDNRLKRAQPGSVDNTTEPDFLVIGRVIRPHGVRGEVRVEIHTQLPERFTWLEQVYVARDPNDATPEAVPVKQARFHKGQALLLLGGHETRDAAEMLRGAWLLVPKAEAIPLEDDEVYHYQLQGLQVYTEAGEHLGILTDILETGANEVNFFSPT
jgi:16S rRNA processing protein RimM